MGGRPTQLRRRRDAPPDGRHVAVAGLRSGAVHFVEVVEGVRAKRGAAGRSVVQARAL